MLLDASSIFGFLISSVIGLRNLISYCLLPLLSSVNAIKLLSGEGETEPIE